MLGVDDRGIGGSAGTTADATYDDLVADIGARLAGDPDATVRTLDGLNQLMQPAATGLPAGVRDDPDDAGPAGARAGDVVDRDARCDRYSNRDGSPAPYRMISGSSPDRSTTVVGSVPHSPESTTASTAVSSSSLISQPCVSGSS